MPRTNRRSVRKTDSRSETGDRKRIVMPRLIPTSRRAKRHALGGQRVLRFLRNTLLEREDVYVTTFFDLHGIRPDFPGRPGGGAITHPSARLQRLLSPRYNKVRHGVSVSARIGHVRGGPSFRNVACAPEGSAAAVTENLTFWLQYPNPLSRVRFGAILSCKIWTLFKETMVRRGTAFSHASGVSNHQPDYASLRERHEYEARLLIS